MKNVAVSEFKYNLLNGNVTLSPIRLFNKLMGNHCSCFFHFYVSKFCKFARKFLVNHSGVT